MKKCSYCGAEYPDDAVECAIDKTPFKETHSDFISVMPPVAKRKIPISLSIVSYLFFFPGAICLVFLVFGILDLIVNGGSNKYDILWCFVGGVLGIFYVSLSRGLRRCSPGWRTCALVITWLGFLGLIFHIGQHFLGVKSYNQKTTIEFLLEYALGFAFQAWQYWVLTRADVRELFYNEL